MTDLNEQTDEALMVLVKAGDHNAFSVLVKRHTQKFFNLAYRTLGKQDEAEDVVQTSFAKLWQKPALWKEDRGAKFTTWFYRVVYNASIDVKRRQKPTYELHENVSDSKLSAHSEYAQKQESQELERAITALPERQQTALNLFYYEELPQKEAADVMGVNIKAFESLLSRAKTALKTYYEGQKDRQEENYGTV